jgi:hypothetical protein
VHIFGKMLAAGRKRVPSIVRENGRNEDMRLTHKRTVCLCLCLCVYLCLSVSVSVSVYVSASVYVHPLTFIYREGEAEGEMARPARTLPAAGSQPIDRNNALQMYGCVVVFVCVHARPRLVARHKLFTLSKYQKEITTKYFCFLEVQLRTKRS